MEIVRTESNGMKIIEKTVKHKDNRKIYIETFDPNLEKPETIEDKFQEEDDFYEKENEKMGKIERDIKNLSDLILDEVLEAAEDKKSFPESRIKDLKGKIDKFVLENICDPIDIVKIFLKELEGSIIEKKNCILEDLFQIQIIQATIQDSNFVRKNFADDHNSQLNEIIIKLKNLFEAYIKTADVLEKIFFLVLQRIAEKDTKIEKINIINCIKETFADCLSQDSFIRKFKPKINKEFFLMFKFEDDCDVILEDLKDIFFKDEDKLFLERNLKNNVKFNGKKGENRSMDINQLLEFILNDDTCASINEPPTKRKKGKNKKKAKKVESKNDTVEHNSSSNFDGSGADDREVSEFRNKLRDCSINAKKAKKIVPSYSLKFFKDLENLDMKL